MAAYHADWYAALSAGQDIRRIDLKSDAGRRALDGLLTQADILLTSSRPSALRRLGLDWPSVPRTLMADLAGAERAVSAVLALLLARERGQGTGSVEVPLAEVARDLAEPYRMGVTRPGALLGGGFPGYALYRASDGWIAVAALEPHFLRALEQEVGTAPEMMAAAFEKHSMSHWERRGLELDIPMVGVRRE
jgi:crotonobetainyl-CoA:carnitine CoA-transferase CaiB-like acyl-CoA transferase